MKQRCIQAVSAAIGRSLTVPEVRDIETRIRQNRERLARQDPAAWQQLPEQDQLREAAKAAADEIMQEASLKKLRLARTIETHDANENFTTEQVAQGYDDYRLQAFRRTLVDMSDFKSNTSSVESVARSMNTTAITGMLDALEAIHPNFLGIMANKEAESLMRRALHGEVTGVKQIDDGAKVIAEQLEILRNRMNRAGGNIGKLDNYGHPHIWSRKRFSELGKEAVVDILFPRVKRELYVHEDGRAYSDAELRDFLGNAWLTVITDGANKQRGSATPGGAIKANRGAEHRQIHFKDGISATEALGALSEMTLHESLIHHVGRLTKDIALIERFGPNADNQFGVLLDRYVNEAKLNGMDASKADAMAHEIAEYYNHLAGNNFLPPKREWLADTAQGLRNLQLFKLGFSPVTSVTDLNTLWRTAAATGISRHRLFMNLLAGFNPANRSEKRAAMRAGLMVKTIAQDMQRIALDASDKGWTSKAGSAFMRMTMLEKMTEVSRRAYAVTAMDTIGQLTREHANVDDMQSGDVRLLKNRGIDQETWDIWRQAQPDSWGGNHTVLTADAIMRIPGVDQAAKERAATKLMAVVLEEQNIAVIEPGVREKVWRDKYQPGTWDGELMRSVAVFKSFPHAFYLRHIERGLHGFDTPLQRTEYLAKLFVGAFMMGIVSNWIADILNGRDPRNIDPTKDNGAANLLAAMLKGGALGIYGDFLFGDITKYGRTPVETVTGPVTGTLAAFDNLVRGNIRQAIVGEETNASSELLTFSKQFSPANLWYTKAAFDRIIFDDLQEFLKPGYLSNMKSKAASRNGTTFWWEPGEAAPDRAPILTPAQ